MAAPLYYDLSLHNFCNSTRNGCCNNMLTSNYNQEIKRDVIYHCIANILYIAHSLLKLINCGALLVVYNAATIIFCVNKVGVHTSHSLKATRSATSFISNRILLQYKHYIATCIVGTSFGYMNTWLLGYTTCTLPCS